MFNETDVYRTYAVRNQNIDEIIRRILKVYGSSRKPFLFKEIQRLARMLGIPIEEVF